MGRRRPCSSLRERAIEREASRGGPEDREEGSATCGAPAARSTGRRGGVEVLVLLCTASMQRNRRQRRGGHGAAELGPWDAGEVAVRERRGGKGTQGWCRSPSGLIPSRASATCRQAATAGKGQEEKRGKERRHGERRRDLVAAAACRRRAGRTGHARGGRGSAGMREEAHGCWWSRHKQRAWAIRRGAAGWLCKTRR